MSRSLWRVTSVTSHPKVDTSWVSCRLTSCVLHYLTDLRRRAGSFFLLFSTTSAGMFVSAPALLPSSSSMSLFMLVMTLWLKGRFSLAVSTFVKLGIIGIYAVLCLRVCPRGRSILVTTPWNPRSIAFSAIISSAVRARGDGLRSFFIASRNPSLNRCSFARPCTLSGSISPLYLAVRAAHPQRQILVSMICVFGTGWPFVGVLFVPMLLNCAWTRLRRGVSFAEGLGAATASATWALLCAIAVGALATWVDSEWYGRVTSPTFNILCVLHKICLIRSMLIL